MASLMRESLIRLTGKRDRYEIMCRLALDSIQREHGLNVALFPGGWAASASLLMIVARIVTELPINRVLELGCGQTTFLLAGLQQKLDFHLTTIEHNSDWSKLINKRSGHDIDLAALTSDGTGYVLNELPGPFDLIIIDGPPGTGNKLSRSGAVEVCRKHLAYPGIVVIDDTERKGEAITASLIASDFDNAKNTAKTIRSTSWQTIITSNQWKTFVDSLN